MYPKITDVFLRAEWRYLAMINYAVPPALLEPFVPPGTRLDLWQGKALLSLVGFRFLDARVRGVAIPFHRNFEAINLRFYVRRIGGDNQRGVAFIKEIVPLKAVAQVARSLYNENYVSLPTSQRIKFSASGGDVAYGFQIGKRWNQLRLRTRGEPEFARPHTEAHFVTDHYFGYATQRDGGCTEYCVAHPPWRLWQVIDAETDIDATHAFGAQFVEVFAQRPTSVLVAEGSEVSVGKGIRVQ